MIGTDEMSSSAMDISESFRAEDLSKTDFFDFVTSAPDMGIGIGVGIDVTGVSLHSHSHHQHQHQQQQHSHNQHQHTHTHPHPHQHQQHHQHQHERLSSSNMTHDGGGGGSGGGDGDTDTNGTGHDTAAGNSSINGNTNDSVLQSYEFWHTDKDQSRLESTIFEDLDRYCWQQQQPPPQPQPPPAPPHPASNANSPQSPSLHRQQQQQQHHHHHLHQHQQHHHHQPHSHQPHQPSNGGGSSASSSSSSSANGTVSVTGNISQPSSASTVSSIDNSDGQIYTLTVLNGNEPWLKRDGGGMSSTVSVSAPSTDAQLQSSLDLDSLLSNFSGYIKSEYPYDDSGFSTDGTKDGNTSTVSTAGNGGGGGIVNGISIPSLTGTTTHHSANGMQTLPSLIVGGLGSGNGAGDVGTTSLSQQLAQFQNNNNDWQMADHNADQNSAESLLRSALQGKGYTKGLHVQNGITLLSSTSPTVKDDEMQRILFPGEADSLSFADSTLSGSGMFDDGQSTVGVGHSAVVAAHLLNGPTGCTGSTSGGGSGGPSLMVDEMFLSLESDYSDDYEKIKRLASEVQQFCTSANGGGGGGIVATGNDYTSTPLSSGDGSGGGGGGVGMQISPTPLLPPVQSQSQLHSPVGTPTGMTPNSLHLQPTGIVQKSQMRADVVISSTPTSTTTSSRHGSALTTGSGRPAKKYKRLNSASAQQHHHNTNPNNNNNNNNPNVLNHNNTNAAAAGSGGPPVNGSGNTTSNSASGGGGGGGGGTAANNSNSPTHCNGQRKERSLHYCSICSKGFKDKYSVNVHIRTHTGEKPFACSLCGKSFRQKAHLAKHYQTHMAQKNNGSLISKSSASATAKSHRNNNNNNNNNNNSTTTNHNTSNSRQQQQQQQQLASINSFATASTANCNGGNNNNNSNTVTITQSPAVNVLGALALSATASSAASTPTTTSTAGVGLLANR